MFIVLLLLSSFVYSMDRPEGSPFGPMQESTLSFESEAQEDEFCSMALDTVYNNTELDLASPIKPYLKTLVRNKSREFPISTETVSLFKDGVMDARTARMVHDMVMKATHDALADRDKTIEQQKKSLNRRVTRCNTACIAAITGLIATCVTTTGAILVAYFSNK